MKITTQFKRLILKYPFKTARREGRKEVDNLIVSIEHEGLRGIGEICPTEYYYGEDFEVAKKVISEVAKTIGNDPFLLEDILDDVRSRFYYAPATTAGIDMALYDLVCKLLNVPLYKYLGLNPIKAPVTSYTIGIDEVPVMIKKLEEAIEYPILKIKVGTPNDIEIIEAIRSRTDATIRIDANTGWNVETAIKNLNILAKYDIEFVEQPIPPSNYQGLRKLKENIPMPIMADEDVKTSADIPPLAGCVDSINIKLMKCGGIREALKMIAVARSYGMKIMLGCMLESSLANAAAAHLSPLVDYADLDTHLLLSDDPYTGLGNIRGKQILGSKPGLGISER